MYCEKCGMQLEEDMVFCPGCGNKVVSAEAEKVNGEVDNIVSEETKTIIYEKKTDEAHETSEENPLTVVEEEKTEDKDEDGSTQLQSSPGQNTIVKGNVIETAKIKYCHNCGAVNAETDAFCYSCGTPLAEEKTEQKKRRYFSFKINSKSITACAVLAVIVIACIVFMFVNKEDKGSLIYLRDNEIISFNGKEKMEIGDDVYEDKSDNYGPQNWLISSNVKISEDGKYIFYPRDYDGSSFDLYYKRLNDTHSEGEKIASSVEQYTVLKKGGVIYKESGSSDKLYVSDLQNKEKIASDVLWFRISGDEKNILWQTSDGDNKIYVCDIELKGEKNRLDTDVSDIIYTSEDLNKIAYMKDDVLYYMENLTEKEKIDSDVEDYYWTESEGKIEIFYMIGDDDAFTLADLIEDDYAAQDAGMNEPNINDYQTVETKPSFWGMREEVVTDDSYYDDLEAYNEKLMRDSTREEFDTEIAQNKIMYRYVLGEESSEEYMRGAFLEAEGYGNPVFLFLYLDSDNIEKVNFSKLLEMNEEETEEKISNIILDAVEVYLAYNGEKMVLDVDDEELFDDVSIAAVDENAKECYITIDIYNESYQTYLYKTNYSEMDGKLELMSDEFGTVELQAENGIYYMTELSDDGTGELYLSGERIDSDVKVYSVMASKDGSGVLYITDPDENKAEGTLKMFAGSESIKIADDVAAYISNDRGEAAFLADYNFNKFRGDLKVYKNGEISSIDSDVSSILYY